MIRKGPILASAAVLIAGVMLMYLFLGMREEQSRRTPPVSARLVETEVVKLQSVAAKIDAFGILSSAQPVSLMAEVSGVIQKGDVPFRPAQRFKRGDVLLRIDDRQIRLRHESAVSELQTALTNFLPEVITSYPDETAPWQRYFDSLKFDQTIPDLPPVTNRRIKLFLSRFNVYKLYFAVRELEIVMEKFTLRAPFDGSIVLADQRVGSNARNGILLGSIINLEELEVAVQVTAVDLPWIDFEPEVCFLSDEFPGQWTGNIARVGSSIDARTQTIPVYVKLHEDGRSALLEGAFFEANIPGVTIENALEIPRRALYDEQYVYLIVNDLLEYRQVGVARTQKNSVIINSGLQDGDVIIIEPLQGVVPGEPVAPRTTLTEGRSPL